MGGGRWTTASTLAVLGVVLVLAIGACGRAEPGAPRGGTVERWTAELELRIGSLDDPVYSLTRVNGLEVGPDGSIYTLHPQEAIVRRFDADGELVGTIGGRGSGPGEFQRGFNMGMVADTLWVLDYDGYRVSQFGTAGDFLGSFAVPFDMGSRGMTAVPPRAMGLLADGTVFGEPPGFSHMLANGSLTERAPVLMTREGVVTQTLTSIPYNHFVWDISVASGGGAYRTQPFQDSPAYAFSKTERALVVVRRDAPETVDEATFQVTKLDFDGDTLFSRSFDFDPVPVRAGEVDSVLAVFAEGASQSSLFSLSEGEARRLAESTLYLPAFRPGVTGFMPARDGTLWIGIEPGDDPLVTWLVLDADGEPLGEVDLPANVVVREADLPFVWGVETDALDVPYVVRYRVTGSIIASGERASGATLAAATTVTEPYPRAPDAIPEVS